MTKPILYKLLFLGIILAVTLVIVSCSFTSLPSDVYISRDISDPNSKLLKVLDCEKLSQKIKDITWGAIHIRQGNFHSTKYDANVEHVTCLLNGMHKQNSTEIGVSILTDLRRHSMPMLLDTDSASLGDYASEKSINPSFLPIGKRMSVKCGERTNDLMCMVVTQFNQTDVLQITLLLDNSKMPLTEIENLINLINGEMNKDLGN